MSEASMEEVYSQPTKNNSISHKDISMSDTVSNAWKSINPTIMLNEELVDELILHVTCQEAVAERSSSNSEEEQFHIDSRNACIEEILKRMNREPSLLTTNSIGMSTIGDDNVREFTFQFDKTFHDGDDAGLVNMVIDFTTVPEDKEQWLRDCRDHEYLDDDKSDFFKHFCEMEEYGVHDAYGGGCTIGYGTYEVKTDKINEVMEKWRDFFISHGIECSPVYEGALEY